MAMSSTPDAAVYLRDKATRLCSRIRANCSCISAKTKASPDGAPTDSLRWRSGTRAQRLVLGRDFLGVRPLYWSSADGVVFASEIKALLRNRRAARAVDETALADFDVHERSWSQNAVSQHPQGSAGTAAICGADGTVRVEDLLGSAAEPDSGIERRALLCRARARFHQASVAGRDVDGPIGSLLSGGNDSSAQRRAALQGSIANAHTFTVGLADVEGGAKYNDIELRAPRRGIDRIGASRTSAGTPTNSSGRFR